jgi:hypothetical protein
MEAVPANAGSVETQPATRRQRSALNARVSEPRTLARRGRTSRPKRALLPLKHRVRRRARASRSSAGRQPHRARVLVFDNVGCRVRPNASFALPSARSKDPRLKSNGPTGAEVPSTGYRGASRANGRVQAFASRGQPSGGFRRRRASALLSGTNEDASDRVQHRL